MQKFYSMSKKLKIHFLFVNFFHVRDRTVCLNSFCVVAYMQHKRVSSDSPTPICKTNVERERYVCFADWGNAQIINFIIMNYLFLLFTCLTFVAYGQRDFTSFYFAEPQPQNVTPTLQFDSSIIGEYYAEKDTLFRFVITPDSIYTQKSLLFTVTKKDIRKSKGKYFFKGNKLYGIVAGEGLTYITKNDTTYAIYNQKDPYFKPANGNILKKQNNIYYLNEREKNGYFTTYLLYPTAKGILIFALDHEEVLPNIQAFNELDSVIIDNIKTYVARPNSSEINRFIQDRGFTDVTQYLKH